MKKNFFLLCIITNLLGFILSTVGIFAIIKSTLASYTQNNLLLEKQLYYIYSYMDKTKNHIGIFVGILFLLHSAVLYKIWIKSKKIEAKERLESVKKKEKKEHIQKKQKEENHQKENALYVFDKMYEGLILMDIQKKIIHINTSAKKFLKIPEDADYLQKNIIYVSRNKTLNEQFDHAIQKGQSFATLKIHDRYLKIYVNSILDQEKVVGIFCLMVDDTIRYQEEKNRKKFTTNITHELKTPLTAIAGYAEIIKDMNIKPEEIQTFSEKIIKNTQTMIDMINNIIKLSSLDTAEKIEKEKIDLDSLVEKVLQDYSIQAQRRHISISKKLQENTYIKANPSLLTDMISNLVSNAIRYNIDQGHIDIEVKTDHEKAIFIIKDTGQGIAEKYKEKVFERFFVVDKSRSKQLGGSGLGLSIVKHIAKIHQAQIQLESQENVGTRIQVEFAKYPQADTINI